MHFHLPNKNQVKENHGSKHQDFVYFSKSVEALILRILLLLLEAGPQS